MRPPLNRITTTNIRISSQTKVLVISAELKFEKCIVSALFITCSPYYKVKNP